MSAIASWICRLLAQFGYFPKGCPGKPPASTIGSDKVTITVKQKDR